MAGRQMGGDENKQSEELAIAPISGLGDINTHTQGSFKHSITNKRR
jgi:hypothetical protein